MKDGNTDTTVTVDYWDRPRRKEVLVECMAKGADDSVFTQQPGIWRGRYLGYLNTIAGAIKRIADYDIIFATTGRLTGYGPGGTSDCGEGDPQG